MKNNRIKIAVAIFGSRISPRFDCAPSMLIAERDRDRIIKRREIHTEGLTALERIKRLRQLQIKVLICGGIDKHSVQMIEALDIMIYSWITGEYEDGLTCFLNGKLASGNIMGPGGISRGRWRFRRWRQNLKRGGARCRIVTEEDQDGYRG